MSFLVLSEQSAKPSAPSSGKCKVYLTNDADPLLVVMDDAGKINSLGGLRCNNNTTDVTANAANTYLTGSSIPLATTGMRAGTRFRWRFCITKTNAGIATPIFTVVFGTNGSTADTARLTFTFVAQTAAVDTGYVEIEVIVKIYSTIATIHGIAALGHNGTTTGLANQAQEQIQQVLSGTFDATIANSIIGVCCNPGTAGVWTFQQVIAEAYNL